MIDKDDPFAALSDEEAQILAPDYALKKIIGEDVDLKQVFNAENIEKAQKVINDHKDSFLDWVMKDIALLEESYARMQADMAIAEAESHKLARVAFVIKSQAGMFGFPLATHVAKSLDDFCNRHFRPTSGHMVVIRTHIDTLSVIFHKNIVGDGGALGKELSENLEKLVKKYQVV